MCVCMYIHPVISYVKRIPYQNSLRQFWASVWLMPVRQGGMNPSGNTMEYLSR